LEEAIVRGGIDQLVELLMIFQALDAEARPHLVVDHGFAEDFGIQNFA
jgi:hypothetical protein